MGTVLSLLLAAAQAVGGFFGWQSKKADMATTANSEAAGAAKVLVSQDKETIDAQDRQLQAVADAGGADPVDELSRGEF